MCVFNVLLCICVFNVLMFFLLYIVSLCLSFSLCYHFLVNGELNFLYNRSFQRQVFQANDCTVNPLEYRGNYSATSNNMKLVHWPLMGGLLHLLQRGGPPRYFAVPNVTAHTSTASVQITVLLYNGPLRCDFNVGIKGLTKRFKL